MSSLIDNIKRLAKLIKNETRPEANTAARVGGLFEEIGAELEQKYDRPESDRIIAAHNTADTSHQNIQDRIGGNINGVNQELTRKITEADQAQAAALNVTKQDLAGHKGNAAIHQTSEQIRAEIVDSNIPDTVARVTDTNTKDRDTLNSAKSYTDTTVTNLGNNVYRKAETYSRPEIDNKDAATLNASKNDVTERLKGKAELSHSHTKAQITDFPTSLPANGGNADTVDGKHATEFQPAGSYATSSHNHTGVYQPTGNYAATDHTHTAGQVTGDATHRFVTDAEKTDWNSKASGTHNHDTAYANKTHNHDATYLKPTDNGQNVTATFTPAATRTNITSGEKLSALFGKVSRWFADLKPVAFTASAADITEQTDRRFMTDAERTKVGYLSETTDKGDLLKVICAGHVNRYTQIVHWWGKPRINGASFTARREEAGTYVITHSSDIGAYEVVINANNDSGYNMACIRNKNPDWFNVVIQNPETKNRMDDGFSFIAFQTK